jgi:hypothetical protein
MHDYEMNAYILYIVDLKQIRSCVYNCLINIDFK